jgi:hypothetical protein
MYADLKRFYGVLNYLGLIPWKINPKSVGSCGANLERRRRQRVNPQKILRAD